MCRRCERWPPAGTVLAAGANQPLSVQFAAGDTTDYAPYHELQCDCPCARSNIHRPSTTPPGEQPTLNFSLTSGYPIPITGTLTLVSEVLTIHRSNSQAAAGR
jgi:hypothetical protein